MRSEPSAPGVTGPTSDHAPPYVRCSSETPAMPRTRPVSVIDDPNGIGAAGTGCWRDIIDTLNAEQTWTAVATGTVAPDGTFALPVAITAGTTYRVVVMPGQGFAPGMTVPQIATG